MDTATQSIPIGTIITGIIGCLGVILAIVGVCSMLKRNDEPDTDAADSNKEWQDSKAQQQDDNKLSSIISATKEGFWMVDPQSIEILEVNPSICAMLEYTRDEMIGKRPYDFADSKNAMAIKRQATLVDSTPHRSYEVTLLTKSGKNIHVAINATTINDLNNPPTVFAFVTDMTERNRYEQELYRQANRDIVTNLPNRHYLTRHVKSFLNAGEPFALLLLDLDNFKIYNDAVGHSFGDTLLASVAKRLSASMTDREVLAHIGGDEFVVVTRQSDAKEVKRYARTLLKSLSSPMGFDDTKVTIGASVGIAMAPEDGDNVSTLLKCADLAMYHAKEKKKGDVCVYKASMGEKILKKLDMCNRVRGALERKEFRLVYQPQISASSRQITGAEVLLRWNNNGQDVSPGDFIPALEETSLIISVGQWVLDNACQQAVAWQQSGHKLRISVNVSALQFMDKKLAATVLETLARTGCPPSMICLELTESLLIDNNTGQADKHIQELSAAGVCFSIDDFGTGYSNLAYLQRLPITEIKIDQTFVKGLPDLKESTALVKTIIAMAKNLGAETVAEGVETQQQLDMLVESGVDHLQGHLFGKPMSPTAFRDVLPEKKPVVVPHHTGTVIPLDIHRPGKTHTGETVEPAALTAT